MNWLFSKKHDLLILFFPVWLCWVGAFSLPEEIRGIEAPLWVWVVFVLGIDVSHVWSTLFRTYLDKEEFKNHRKTLITAPLLGFLLAFVLASISIFWFWRVLAYVALFHFIKQQYGFMRIYKAKAKDFKKQWLKDDFIIYLSMLYPVLFWHLGPHRDFSWFMTGDFITSPSLLGSALLPIFNVLFFLLIGLWFIQELATSTKLPIGKVLWVLTTAGNWYIGIVHFNSDVIFTITNVVAHGVPYVALILFYQKGKTSFTGVSTYLPMAVIVSILALAMVEEYFWDLLVNQEKKAFFSSFLPYFESPISWIWVAFFTALLSLPQITHYIIDGFIWKNNKANPYLKKILLD